MESVSHSPSPSDLAQLLNDCSIDAITAIDVNWKIIAWNSAAEQFSGLLKTQAIGQHLLEVCSYLAEDRETLQAIGSALDGFKSFVSASAQFNHRQHIENHYLPLRDNSQNLIGVMNIMHDVSHRIKAERQLQHLNRQLEQRYLDLQKTTGELATFTYITSNNIKEPIKQIYTAVEYLITNEAKQLSDAGKGSFRRIQSSLSKMNLLLEDILSLSQINILQKPDQEIDLNNAVTGAVLTLEKKIKERRVTIKVDELCTVIGHREQLSLLFYHLLDNAIKFNQHAEPLIIITCVDIPVEEITGVKLYHQVSIKDNGIGFAPEAVEKIFNMFEKLHSKESYRGAGMGLAIARKIMDTQDGFILAESSLGSGSVFHCYFPVK